MGVAFVSLCPGPGEPTAHVVFSCVGDSLQHVLCFLLLVPSLCWESGGGTRLRDAVPHMQVRAVSPVARRSPAPCQRARPSVLFVCLRALSLSFCFI